MKNDEPIQPIDHHRVQHHVQDLDKDQKENKEQQLMCQACRHMSFSELESNSHALTHMTYIIPHLYLGSNFNAINIHEVKNFEVETIINVARGIQKTCCDEFKYIKYDWDDIFCFDILMDIDEIVDLIHDEISKKRTVLVHCAAGISRSSSVVIGYLMKYEKMTYDDAYNHVKTLRSCINPNSGFVEQLKTYGEKLSTCYANTV
jgi:protein-tyrosine phosphatase